MAKLNIVGVGPGSPDYVTEAAKLVVSQAQLVIGAQRSIDLVKEHISGEVKVLTAQNVEETLKLAVDSAKNVNTVLLSTGDPGFAGLLRSVLERNLLSPSEVNVVPAVSSLQVCAARLGMLWDNVRLLSFHEGATEEKKGELAEIVRLGKNVFVLPDPKAFPPSEITGYLIRRRIDGKTRVFLCENLTLENEKITETTLSEVTGIKVASLCVMVIKNSQ
ncbi:MAG: precorrin-6y C5,15-methyltransferase (decarboxylating) subunit CbiE [Candidatus Bathyarchaeota archaeon]|nr:precorrin-6y C5,15-methyltransferase (decarboxylating) subunit CbiE [Candidatus Bathyarchaeota archaeon]